MRNLFIFSLFIFITITGCKKIDELTQFEIEYDTSVEIPASTAINLPINLASPDVETNSESTFALNNTRKDLIEEIRLTQFDLTLTSPTNGDLGFLKSVEIFISASGLDEIKIAWKDNVSSTVGKYLELNTSSKDLKEYIKKDDFKLRVNTVTDEVISSDHKIDIHSEFFVDAKILGQ